jgi:hypothetical protein
MLERIAMLCRHVHNAAIEERREAWRLRGVTVTYYQQKAELPDIKDALPEYGESTARCCKMSRCESSAPSKPFSVVTAKGKYLAILASMAEIATTASPIHSSAMAVNWTMACSFSPRLAGLLSAGRAN